MTSKILFIFIFVPLKLAEAQELTPQCNRDLQAATTLCSRPLNESISTVSIADNGLYNLGKMQANQYNGNANIAFQFAEECKTAIIICSKSCPSGNASTSSTQSSFGFGDQSSGATENQSSESICETRLGSLRNDYYSTSASLRNSAIQFQGIKNSAESSSNSSATSGSDIIGSTVPTDVGSTSSSSSQGSTSLPAHEKPMLPTNLSY